MEKIDELDRKILKIITQSARIPFKEVAEQCGVSRAAVHQRVQKMFDNGVITGSSYHVQPKMLGYQLCVYIGITMEKQLGANDTNAVVTALKQGKYVISAQSAGIFTRGGHFIVLAGVTSSGRIIVYDPNGGNHYVGETFTMSQISASGTQYWVFDK